MTVFSFNWWKDPFPKRQKKKKNKKKKKSRMKLQVCSFSGWKIPCSKGKKYIKSDGKVFWFFSGKTEAHSLNKMNPRKFNWTLVYRTLHKKGQETGVAKK